LTVAALAPMHPLSVRAMHRARMRLKPRENCTPAEWAEKYRTIATGARKGPFRWNVQPVLRGILEAYGDPNVREVVGQKPSQIGWTTSVTLNVIGYHVHVDPSAILVFFPKDKAGVKFVREKLDPTIRDTAVLAELIKTGTRRSDNTQDFKGFPGGFLQLSGVNSPANVKSTDARVALVEEPDDVGKNVKGQGSSISHAKARTKSFPNRKILIGGAPTIEGFSTVEEEMKLSDKRHFYVACPHCEHEQTLRWEQVKWQQDALVHHPVFGTHQPETARYLCESCAVLWTEGERIGAITAAAAQAPHYGWRATAPFTGVAGFYLSELQSIFSESRLEVLVRSFLTAQHKLELGDDSGMIEFINGTLGELWRLKSSAPELEDLAARGEEYALLTVPAGGLVATAGVDVQHDRLAIEINVWGRGEESWTVYADELPGNPHLDAVWEELDKLLARPIVNHGGGQLAVSAVSIDSGDGNTSEAVYKYVRGKRRAGLRGYMAIKGSSKHGREIFSPPPTSVDTTQADKASKYGLRVYAVGTDRAKDLIANRIKLEGYGPGRIHWPRAIRADYLRQLTSEVKFAPRGGRAEWKKKAGERNEFLDCKVYATHAARRLRVHTLTEAEWLAIEARVRQPDLLKPAAVNQQPTRAEPPPRGSGGFSW
jgi:phage terminase large subunit GpA-like protein